MNTYNFHKTTANYDPVFKNEALMTTLTLNERVVYGMFHGWMATSEMNGGEDFFLSADSIVEETGLSPATVKRIIAKMKELGYITQTKKGYSGRASRYVVKHVDQIEAEYQAAKGCVVEATEQPVIVSEPVSIPTQPVEVKVEQKASESVTVPVVSNGIMNLPSRTIPKQVVEQKVEQNELEVLLADKEYIALAAKKKDFSYFDTVTALKAGKFNNQFGIGVNSDFYKQYQAKRAA